MIRAQAHRPPDLRSRPTSARRARMKTDWRRARRRAQRKEPRQRGDHAPMSAPARDLAGRGGRRIASPRPAQKAPSSVCHPG
eukprot:5296211-Prymnesium_polylepis.1